ncbi:MAG: hypothetical protein ACK5NF_06920 [Bacilli bacterium]
MNAIVVNKLKEIVSMLDIDIMKTMDGNFEIEEIISNFSIIYFNKMVLDITAIKHNKSLVTYQKLSIGLDINKIILLLPKDDFNNPDFLSDLVSLGIYNFTTNREGILYLYNHANAYRDVAQYHKMNRSNVPNTKVVEKVVEKIVEVPIYTQVEVPSSHNVFSNDTIVTPTYHQRIIGIRNVTEHAGSTTFIHMLYNILKIHYKVACLEVDRADLMYFSSNDYYSTTNLNLANDLNKFSDMDIILLDLNNSTDLSICNELLYLLEPSTIKLNKLIRKNRNIFKELNGKKVILNQSMLSDSDVRDFEAETRIKIFQNIPDLNDRMKNEAIKQILRKIGILNVD